jgi:hypothetical protein
MKFVRNFTLVAERSIHIGACNYTKQIEESNQSDTFVGGQVVWQVVSISLHVFFSLFYHVQHTFQTFGLYSRVFI